MLLAEILQDEYELEEAADGLEAVNLLRQGVDRYALMLLDLMMPGMDGFKVMEAVKEYHWEDRLPIMIISADSSAAAVDRAFNLGAMDFISRPFDVTVVHHRIMNTLMLQAFKQEHAALASGGGQQGGRLDHTRTEYDVWTGLNRPESFYRKAEELIRERRDIHYCLIAIDIEHFKLFNELYGRDAGDAFLFGIARNLKKAEKTFGGIAGYFGEDNFAFLAPDSESVASQIQKQIAEEMPRHGGFGGFVPVLGVFGATDQGLSVVTMYDRAALAVSKAKENYNNRICYYEAEMLHEMQDEHMLMLEIQQGLKKKEFVFFVQPQCDIHTGKIVGGEALVRWDRGEAGFVSPGRFIPLVEKTGYITEVDRYIWESVCRWQRDLLDRGIRPVPVSVNVSQKDLFFMDVAGVFQELIRKYSLDPKLIKIEITESAYAKEIQNLDEVVQQLRSAGFCIYMDDFGSGYSSLNMLENVNVDVVKLDMRLLANVSLENKRGTKILEMVVHMVHMLGMPLIAEGVETQEQVLALKNMGCTYVQGYYYYRPIPVPELEKILEQGEQVSYEGIGLKHVEQFHIREFMDQNLFSDTLMNQILGPLVFLGVHEDWIEVLRMNELYYQIVEGGSGETENFRRDFLESVCEEDWDLLWRLCREAASNHLEGAGGVVRFRKRDGDCLSLQLRIFFLYDRTDDQVYYVSAKL